MTVGRNLVVRGQVEAGKPYSDYKHQLRLDFCYACAYCTMTELEAAGIGYAIDHYQPQKHGGSDDYQNLYWSCTSCNGKKLDYWPDATGGLVLEITRVDRENPEDHIDTDPDEPYRLIHKTEQGRFNIQMLGLNMARLSKLRRMRADAGFSANLIRQGLRALSQMRLDELPTGLKHRAVQLNEKLKRSAQAADAALETVLQEFAIEQSKSDLIDTVDDDKEATRERAAYLRSLRPLGWKRAKR